VFPLKDNIPTDRPAIVTIALILINVLVYFMLQKGGILSGPDDTIVVDWGAIPYEFSHPGKECAIAAQQIACSAPTQLARAGLDSNQPPFWVTAFSSMFMHGSILHLGGNMLFLWIFGNNVEDVMGYLKFVVFYLLGGLAAIAAQIIVEPNAAVPTVGASGAVAAVLGGYILLYPRARVVTLIFIVFFFTILELPAVLILGFWFLQQVAFGAYGVANPVGGGGGVGGVAYFAHIGGFAFGLLTIKLFASRNKDYSPPPRFPVS
jgi:membrane associated rhomboid family serine protease